jgi:hypothetical protein
MSAQPLIEDISAEGKIADTTGYEENDRYGIDNLNDLAVIEDVHKDFSHLSKSPFKNMVSRDSNV